jgi:hypothetical protein
LAVRFEYIGMVIESPDHGPEACAGVVLESFPPQCGGIPLPNFDWDTVTWAEQGGGSTWADVILTGHFDGHELTLIAPPEPIPTDHVWGSPAVDLTPPCDEPAGGWTDTRSADVDHLAASTYAAAQDGFAGQWLYRPQPSVDRVVLVFTFTGDLPTHTQRLGERYDGALCVGAAPRSLAELEEIREELKTVLHSAEARDRGIYPGLQVGYLLTTGLQVPSSSVEVTVWAALDQDAAQSWLDSLYGDHAVLLRPVLTPVDS